MLSPYYISEANIGLSTQMHSFHSYDCNFAVLDFTYETPNLLIKYDTLLWIKIIQPYTIISTSTNYNTNVEAAYYYYILEYNNIVYIIT